mgnify:CR=1 FL=1
MGITHTARIGDKVTLFGKVYFVDSIDEGSPTYPMALKTASGKTRVNVTHENLDKVLWVGHGKAK